MRNLKIIVASVLFLSSLTGCSWTVNLVIANDSSNDVVVKYSFPPNDPYPRFLKKPDTYSFDKNLANIRQRSNKVTKLQSTYFYSQDSTTINVIVKPGQALHIGRYRATSENRDTVISKYNLVIEIENGTVSNFEHWKNMFTDLLTIK